MKNRAEINTPITVAVLGSGSIGSRHLKVLSAIPNVRCLSIPVRAGRIRELDAAGIPTCPSLEEAAALGASLAIIATDTKRHIPDSLHALALGYHLLVEKPIGVDLPDARAIQTAAGQAPDRKVFLGCVLRFSESLNRFQSWLARLGTIHSVRIECQSCLPDWRPQRPYRESYSARSDEGGVLRDLIHEIDYAGWLFGWPESLQARLRNLGRLGIESEEAADLLWETPSQALVSVRLDYLTRPAIRRMHAAGESGVLEWNAIAKLTRFVSAEGGIEESISEQTPEQMFLAQAVAVVRACQGETDERLATLEDGIRAIAICDAARAASKSGARERVESL